MALSSNLLEYLAASEEFTIFTHENLDDDLYTKMTDHLDELWWRLDSVEREQAELILEKLEYGDVDVP